MLKVANLSKTYKGSEVKAVNGLSFDIGAGEIYGLLGLNGAGKSTTFKCITGIIPFDEGSVEICGHDLKTEELAAKAAFGFIPDNHAVFDGLTGREYVNFMANAYKVDKAARDERLEKFCEMFCFASYLDNQIKSYSHGMKQKIAIMGGIIHYPKLWILDEPLLGLDPKSIKQIQDFMLAYAADGNSILFSSHILDTVDKLCSKILIIDGGESRGEYDLAAMKAAGSYDINDLFFGLVKG